MKFWSLPNALTYFRLILIPVFVGAFYLHVEWRHWATGGIFLLAALTDWLDGFLARYLKQASAFGAFLDPVADKLMVGAALVLLVSAYPVWWVAIAGVVIVSREIVISALREWMAEIGKRATVKVSMIGKLKTVAQMLALLILLSQPVGYTLTVKIGFVLMYVAVVLTIWSMMYYLIAAWKVLSEMTD